MASLITPFFLISIPTTYKQSDEIPRPTFHSTLLSNPKNIGHKDLLWQLDTHCLSKGCQMPSCLFEIQTAQTGLDLLQGRMIAITGQIFFEEGKLPACAHVVLFQKMIELCQESSQFVYVRSRLPPGDGRLGRGGLSL